MNTFEFFILLIAIVFAVYLCRKQKKDEYNKEVQRMRDRDILYSQQGNRSLLKQFGEEKYARLFGEDKLQMIKENRDTKMFEMKSNWKETYYE